MDEFAALESLPIWRNARSVADVGCGNGDYVARLKSTFPEKQYAGFDTSDVLIKLATENYAETGISFHSKNIADAISTSSFDAVILRFVVQHLEDHTTFFESLKSILSDDGFAVVIEPDLEASAAMPELTGFRELVTAYNEVARACGSTRSMLQNPDGLQRLLGYEWSVAGAKNIQSRHERANWNKRAVREVMFGWVNAIEASQSLPWDYPRLKQEIFTWLDTGGQRFDIALTAAIIRPN